MRRLVELEDAPLYALYTGIPYEHHIGRITCSRRNGQRGRSRQSRKSPQAVGTQVNAALELQGDGAGDTPALHGLKGGRQRRKRSTRTGTHSVSASWQSITQINSECIVPSIDVWARQRVVDPGLDQSGLGQGQSKVGIEGMRGRLTCGQGTGPSFNNRRSIVDRKTNTGASNGIGGIVGQTHHHLTTGSAQNGRCRAQQTGSRCVGPGQWQKIQLHIGPLGTFKKTKRPTR